MMIFTVLQLLEDAVIAHKNKIALVDGETQLTFGDLRAESIKTAQALRELGVNPGDRVGICMEKSIDQVIAIMGVLYAEGIIVPLLPKIKSETVRHIVLDAGIKLVVADEGRLKDLASVDDEVRICLGHGELKENLPSLPYMRGHMKYAEPFFQRISSDPAAIIYSSGSTGMPKGITVSHRNLFDGAHIVSDYLGIEEDDRIASVLSFNFDYGLNQIWQTLLKRATLYLHRFLFPKDLFFYISKHRITVMPVMPVIISQMFDPRLYRPNPDLDLSSVRIVCTSGGPVSKSMIENIKGAFSEADIFLMYGLTEAFRSTYLPPSQIDIRPDSIGKAIPSVQIFILDQDGNECPSGEIGELVHRGGCISLGYWNSPEKTAERFRTHPRFPNETLVYSGDLARKDEDGYLYFVGRRDELIKTRGYRVSPTEIENIANKYNGVEASVAFGIANVENTQDVVLSYVVTSGQTVDEVAFRQFLKENLISYMIPRHLVCFDSFDSTGNMGKIDRTSVKELTLEKLDTVSAGS